MIDTDPSRWRGSPRPASTLSVSALVAALFAVVLSGCGSSGGSQPSAARAHTMTVVVRTTSTVSATRADVASPHHRSTAPAPPAVKPTVVALVRRPLVVRSAPGGGRSLGTIGAHTEFGSSTALPVVKRRGAWLGVISLLAGNGHLAWIRASARATSLTSVGWRIYVSIDRQQITVLYGNEIVRRIQTSTGVAGATTPTGRFAVTDRLSTGVAEGPYGCCILALSAVQPLHLSDWDGGNRIAIHATDDTADLGHPASHGCAHVDDANGRWLLAHIPDGTPVVIANAPFHRDRGSPA